MGFDGWRKKEAQWTKFKLSQFCIDFASDLQRCVYDLDQHRKVLQKCSPVSLSPFRWGRYRQLWPTLWYVFGIVSWQQQPLALLRAVTRNSLQNDKFWVFWLVLTKASAVEPLFSFV